MIHISRQLDGERLRRLELPGFPDETVLAVPVGDRLLECGFRVMEGVSHVAVGEPPRKASLDEVAEVAAVLLSMAERGAGR
jgi:hypothetical protein